MDCPLGHGALHDETHSGIAVTSCSVCGGEWLARDKLADLEATAVKDRGALMGMVEYQAHPSERNCPVCARPMYEFDYRANPLELDACPEGHGYWLDGGEEARVRELIQQRARDLHRASQAENSFGTFLNNIRSQFGGRSGRRP